MPCAWPRAYIDSDGARGPPAGRERGPVLEEVPPFEFRRRPSFPKTVSEEFLLVDLLHNLERLAEDRDAIRERALALARAFDRKRLAKAVYDYDSSRVRNLLASILEDEAHGAAA